MSCYAIAVGGSGARAVESLVHLCAAGLGPRELKLVFVDPDRANGNVQRALHLVRTYQALQSIRRSRDTRWLGTRISLLEPEVWSPFSEAGIPKLEDFFRAANLRATAPAHYRLLSVCYGPHQLALDLRGGFRAMPSIGAAVFGAKVDMEEEEPWRTLHDDLSQSAAAGEFSHVYVCGSIFGGTGASGFPTIGRLIARALASNEQKVARGGALLLPYFGFAAPRASDREIFAHSEDFLIQTHAGLKYYASFLEDLGYDRLYVVGDEERATYKTAPFANVQQNRSHFIELLAASAALDFFGDKDEKTAKDPRRRVAMCAREKRDEFAWTDVPRPKETQESAQAAVGRYARMSFAYLHSLHPALEHVRARTRRRIPWVVTLMRRAGVDVADDRVAEMLERQKDLSLHCLVWLYELQGGDDAASSAVRARLFDSTAVTGLPGAPKLDDGKFASLVLEPPQPDRTVDWVWRRLASERRSAFSAEGLGYFQSALYRACR